MTSFRIALNFEDGVTRFVDCGANEKVLDAAFRNRINLPMDCSDGVCGTCKCRAENGTYDMGDDFIEDALTQDEAEQNFLKTMRPTSLLGRFTTTDEVANMVVYLCSEQASGTTGAALRVDGGVLRQIA